MKIKKSIAHQTHLEERPQEIRDVWEEYFVPDFEINPADLKGKILLDIGAHAQEFAAAAHLCGVQVKKIISLDPLYGRRKIRKMRPGVPPITDPRYKTLRYVPEWIRERLAKHSLCGFVEEIPLKTESVDMVFMHAVPVYEERALKVIREIVRVLIDGGEARIYPVEYYDGQPDDGGGAILQYLGHMKKEGVTYELRMHEQVVSSGAWCKTFQDALLIIRKQIK